MKKTSQYFDENKNLIEASRILNSGSNDLVSIKIRPIDIFPINDNQDYWDRYVYKAEYEEIKQAINGDVIGKGFVGSGNAIHYEFENESFLFVEHETGPEIIVIAALITSSLTLGQSVIELITTIVKTINEKNNDKKAGKSSDRYYEPNGITIEIRDKTSSKIIKIDKLPLNDNNIITLTELIKAIRD